MRGQIARIEPQRLAELVTSGVVVLRIERVLARGEERLDLRLALAPFRLGILDTGRGLVVRDVDQKNARPEIDGLLIVAGARGAIAVREVLLDLALIVAACLSRRRREVEVAGRRRRRCVERKAAERRSSRCGRGSIERERAEGR